MNYGIALRARRINAINFMIKQARGLVCVPVTDDVLDRLEIKEMVQENTDPNKTAFTVSFDAHSKHGISTGISAFDRAKSIRVMVHPESKPDDIISPGEFEFFRDQGLKMGFTEVVSGPLVRSSYRADKVFNQNNVGIHLNAI